MVTSVKFLSDRKILASISENTIIRIWDAVTGNLKNLITKLNNTSIADNRRDLFA